MKKLSALFLTAGMLIAGQGFADFKPELKIEEVKGGGSGCRVDDDGNPIGWNVTVDNNIKALVADFSEFLVNPDISSSYCDMRIWVSLPQGYTFFTYESEVTGTSDIAEGEYAKLTTSLLFNGKSYPMKKSYKINAGDDDWETGGEKYPGATKVPCGGDKYKIGFAINLDMFGKNSEAQVSSKQGKFTRINYVIKKCD